MTEVQVLVVGAGPVGLTAAYELARRGVRVQVVDAADGPATTSRAITTHPRTLETYDQMGILADILAKGHRIAAFSLFRDGRRLVRLDADYSQIPTRFPFTLMIDQVSTEEVLRAALAGLGVPVRWGTRLESFEQDDSGVVARLVGPAGRVDTVPVGWLVGCDGGHSTVRKALGLPLLGESTETWLLADARVDTELDRTSLYWIRVGNGTCMAGPMPGENRWRMLDTTDIDFDGDLDAIAERFTRKLSAGVGQPVVVGRPSWVSVFTAQQRMVPAMRVGRCFVAGDAAHVHSPASGQGMNTGVQEAYNLAWKLAMVVHGQAGAGLLDSYGAERVPIGRDLLGSTRKATRLVALKDSLAAAALPLVFGIVHRVTPIRRRIQRRILGRVAGLGIAYPDSALSRPVPDPTLRPRPGERVCQINPDDAGHPGWQHLLAELRDPRWTLLVFDRPTDLEHPWLSVRTISQKPNHGDPRHLPDPTGHLSTTLNATPGTWLLIRPDGYLAARGTSEGALTAAELAAAVAPAHVSTGITALPSGAAVASR